MRQNKVFAGILAAAMMMSVGVSAMAVTPDVDYDADMNVEYDIDTVNVGKIYRLVGEGVSPAEDFELVQVGEGVVTDGEAAYAPSLGKIQKASFAKGDATTDGTRVDFEIELPDYTSVGVYEYTLQEVAGRTAGTKYYEGEIKLIVTVVNGKNGTLRVAAVHTEAKKPDGTWDDLAKSDEFENTYTTNKLTLSKRVTGLLGSPSKVFTFKVTLNGTDADKDYPEEFDVNVTNATDERNPQEITLGEETEFYLTDGSSISIDIPEGVKWEIEENDYSEDGYETTVTNGNATGTMEQTDVDVEFVNSKGGNVDTGVILDNAPYTLMLAVVGGGAIVMLAKKRREE